MAALSGRTALVTGASSGLGEHFARLLSANGAAVGLSARRADRLDQLASEINAGGGRAFATPMDVADPISTRAAFDAVEAALGPIDAVVANAGMNSEGLAVELAPAELERVLMVNVSGVFLTVSEGARRMIAAGSKEREHGRVVIISSITANQVSAGLSAYSASKAAVQQLGKVLAREWASKGISVNIINPGYIETDLNAAWFASDAGRAQIAKFPRRRLLEPSDLDPILLTLVSDAARRITGSVFTIDDGQSL